MRGVAREQDRAKCAKFGSQVDIHKNNDLYIDDDGRGGGIWTDFERLLKQHS